MSLWDYLMGKLGSIRVSKRVPAAASMAQRGIVARTAGSQPIRVPTWSSIQLIRDEFSGAAAGKVILTALALVGSPHLPYGNSTVVEVHPKISA